ncbi:hypothetical protein Sjap_017019 [Stephania japonica]|uniref:Protein CHAPERONE-LIKE PROTEIN OF POR1, chloroplastic n=1 Tax=Stephania japonica TaxID=461633 RepID=A0AAP0I5D4_9MAGN
MSASGLTCNPSRFSPLIPCQGSLSSRSKRFLSFPCYRKFVEDVKLLQVDRSYWSSAKQKSAVIRTPRVRSAMDASFGSMADDSAVVFPRVNVRDPYKRLGISREASDDEIQAARNFLISQYAGHKPSVDAIESAHDKIIMQKFHERRRPKLNIKKKMRDISQSRVVQFVTNRFQTPATNHIIKTAVVFVLLGVLTVLYPTEEGPTLQVAISLLATIYFLYDRLKSKLRAVLYGAGAFGISWLLATFLMVSVIPPILRGPRSLEVTTSLITYVLLWVSSTYVK